MWCEMRGTDQPRHPERGQSGRLSGRLRRLPGKERQTVTRGIWCALLFVALAADLSRADEIRNARPGDFDGYILALSWSPTWCAVEGEEHHPQCDPAADHGFIVHGLWPQKGDDWPAWCHAPVRNPSRRETAEMADLMGSADLAWYQWKKHGRCTGLDPVRYFELVREASARIRRPAILRKVKRPLKLSPRVIEEAFLEANPGLQPDMVTVTCEDGYIDEVRICLDRRLRPAICPDAAARDCALPSATLLPVR